MIRIRIRRGGAVDCRALLRVPLSASKTWGQVRDFRRFASRDYFHASIEVAGGIASAGAALRMKHRFFLFSVNRVGKICRWKEGVGFAFSDLSIDGIRSGFPHIFSYRLEPTSPTACNLHLCVAGKWTATLIPQLLVWLWLRWIMHYIVQSVENELLIYELWLKKRRPNSPTA